MLFRAVLSRSVLISLGVATLVVGALVFAYVDRTVFVPEQMVIIPERATSESWSGVGNTYTQDLDEYALFQDFDDQNSAFIDVVSLQQLQSSSTAASELPVKPSVNGLESFGSEESPKVGAEGSAEVVPDASAEAGGEVIEEADIQDSFVSPAEPVTEDSLDGAGNQVGETSSEAEPQDSPVESSGEETSEEVSLFTEQYFPLAQLDLLTNFQDTTEVGNVTQVPDEELVEEENASQQLGEELVEVVEVPSASEEAQGNTPTNVSDPLGNEAVIEDSAEEDLDYNVPSNDGQADNIDGEGNEESLLEEIVEEAELATDPDEGLVQEDVVVVYDPMSDCVGQENCQMYSTVFDGFSIPEFAPGHFLTAAQVRLSLSAKSKVGEDKLRRYVVEYTYGDKPYQVATIIDIEDEISNSLNGGYFLVSLDKPANQSDISLLKVRVSFQGDINDLERAYIEGVWLEVTSGTFYEETDPNYLKDSLDYERDLLAPQYLVLNHPDVDVSLGELPVFSVSYSPQQNFLLRAFNALFSENTYLVDRVVVKDNTGQVTEVPIEVIYHDDKTWSLRFKEQPQKLLPGKYSLELYINENETLVIDSFEFYWGVLAVNTTKNRYQENEEVKLHLAALTDQGDTICDANLELKIINPNNDIYEVPVKPSGVCGKNNVTDVPDYLADFKETQVYGRYTIQLQHKNLAGAVVHKIQDHFEVSEYIPLDIERKAPTRIFPLAAYKSEIKIKANRDFVGDIKERVPRGFVFEDDASGAELMVGPNYTELIWRQVNLREGEELTLSYLFDAPNISPFMYLLGPLDMDGYREFRQWQIASDALTAIGSFTGTRTVAGTNLNQAASPLQWSTSTVDSFYYTHSTTSNSHQVTIKEAGDYFLSVNLPQNRTDGNNSRTRIGLEVRVNGVAMTDGLGRSGYIRNQNSHSESSSEVSVLLENLAEDDYVEVYAEGLTTIDVGDTVNVTGRAYMMLDYISASRNVFSATTTRTTNSTNLNQATAYALQWTETRQDSGFTHSDSINPENIVIADPGLYLVTVNVPLTGDTAQQSVLGRVLLGGSQVSGGILAQGYTQSSANESDGDSSIHWTGLVQTSTSSQVLTVTTERDAAAGTSSVSTGFVGSIYIEELPTTDIIALSGTQLVSGTNWNPAAASQVQWSSRLAYDSSVYTHSTSSNSHNITINESGSYLLVYNDALNQTLNRANTTVQVLVNGVAVSGGQVKSHYIRNQSGHNNSSGAMMFLLENLNNTDVVTVTSVQEANNGTLDDTTPALLMLWQKTTLNERPASPTMYNEPFDNVRFASTTPYFDFSASDPDGASDIVYEFQISTSSSFTASTTFNSISDSEFSNTASTTDTSPFIEGNRIRLQLTGADALTDLQTYYWRVRAKDVSGSNEFGEWSTTQSLTVDLASEIAKWYQTKEGQFESDDLVGAVVSGDGVEVEVGVNTQMMIAYGDSTNSTPRYRLWDGTSWGIQQDAISVGAAINWVRTAAGINRDEYVLVTLNDSNDAHAQIYNGTTTTWGNQVLLSDVVATDLYRGIAVTYESVSGDAMAISCTNSPNPVYRTWDGTSWSATSTITVSSINNCNFLQVASDPMSDEIILVVRDTGSQYEALVWNGSAWTDNRVLGSSAKVAREGMTVAYETSGDQAVIAVSDGLNGNVFYTTWNGTQFSDNAQQQISSAGHDFEFGVLKSDPSSDNLALCYIDDDNDITVLRWNGGGWLTYSTGNSDLDGTGNSDLGRPIDCEYETTSGRGGNLLVMYADTVNARYQVATNTTAWSGEQTITGIEDSFWTQSEIAGDGTIVAVFHDDAVAGDEIESTYWNGTSWATKQAIIPNPSSIAAAPYETYDMSAKRFQYTEGDVTSSMIDFDYVPNRSTWGDLSFSTTEPLGTDVKVKLKYTSSTTCDTYIPNGVLSGNGAGFDVASSAIDISGLSTSTYNQICIEATISSFGAVSASLDDWTVSWVREPKLNQSAYRFYVNGSFLTPTDAWPVGGSDLSENTPLSSSEAISVDEAIRIRIALEDSNVDLPINSETFKLQYAEGLTCTTELSWSDVGPSSSSTAIWRGYQNTIVGSDWYSGSWLRRVKLTVDESLVNDDVTDFPVYVDLADLPSAFFTNVQSDGDDIRVTTSDGVTERPYHLVSISTTTETGELHFKGTLSSTTDTIFYIYYGNATATAYSASATYGSQNVWSNGYSLRYHMGDNPAGSSPQFRDSTSNSNDAVARAGMTSGDVVSGKLGTAIDLDGNDGGTFETALAYGGTFTATMWWYSSSTGFAIAGPAGANEKMGPWNSPAGRIFARTISSSDTSVTSPSDNNWHHIALTRDSSNKVDIHINGTTTRLYSDVAQSGTSDWQNFGGETTQGFIGRMDELRFANVRRTNGWIQTEFNNQSNPTGFYAVSAEEPISDGRLIPTTLLTDSDNPETYEEENPTRDNQTAIVVGDASEWDFVVENNNATANTNYCFRMVYADGSVLNSYTNYPRVITNSPPLTPILTAPFDNEELASTTPWFEFSADDALNDLVSYEIEIDNDYDFSSPSISRESNANFEQFTNLTAPSERGIYSPGQTIQFIPNTTIATGTYWWRVRAKDDEGSNTFSSWSTPDSFTVNGAVTITTWLQTTGEQFATNVLEGVVENNSTDDVRIASGFTSGTTTSGEIDYDDRDSGNAWGELIFTDVETSGTIDYYVEYEVTEGNYTLVPDAVLPGNSSGFNTSPVSLANLNTTTYNELRLMAVFSGNTTFPQLQDWRVTWRETIDIPTIESPFDNAKLSTTTPSFLFLAIDPEDQDLEYEFQLSTTSDFAASSTFLSGTNPGFVNTASSTDTSSFISGDTIQYTIQSALTNGTTYWWRVRARDPGGSNLWSEYSTERSFTIDTAITTSVWYQTTGDQFATDDLVDIETVSGGAQITSTLVEVMLAYGEGTNQAPQYITWDGNNWSTQASAASVGAEIRWHEIKAAPTRPEYALGTLSTDLDINFQIYDGNTDSWGDVFEMQTNSAVSDRRSFNLAYESNSGDLVAVVCDGHDAVYATWNGTTWSATSSITLTNANTCEFVQMASDPNSDEVIAVFRHNEAATVDFEAWVWNGTSWGNSSAFGDMTQASYEGMALAYEESGGQAVVVVSDGAANSNRILYNTWNGSSWTGTSTHTTGDHIEWATLKADAGSDQLALCYFDHDSDIGILKWTGSGWGTFSEATTIGNDIRGRSVDCEFQVGGSEDGYVRFMYSDTGGTALYNTYATSSFLGASALSNMPDSWEMNSIRAGDDTIHLTGYDDGAATDDILGSRFTTSWTNTNTITSNASLDGSIPQNGGASMAAQIYPNFTSGSIRSTAIDFNDGSGPRWEEVSWNDTTPGSSVVTYRVYYLASTSAYVLVPDSALSGNSTGFTTSPIDISDLDRTIYETLQIDAQLDCVAGDCPSIQDWSVEWAEGINVSGVARGYDETASTTSGTVAVAVNGVLQSGKTGTIQPDGTWSIANVTAFPDDTVMVFVDGAVSADEAIAVATYGGVGDITGMELNKRHITIGSNSAATTTNAGFIGYDNADDEDIFATVSSVGVLQVCAEAGCEDARLKIKSGTRYTPGANVSTYDFENNGTFAPATNTLRLSGTWDNSGTFIEDTSTVIFTATTTSSTTLVTSSSTHRFYNLTFGESTGSSTWNLTKPLVVSGNLTVNYGTLARSTSTINIAQNLSVGVNGFFSGLSTTTFDGSSSYTWGDAKSSASSTNIGYVVIDGTTKTITLSGNVAAESVTIGNDDTLNASGSGYNINVYRNWTNNNSFIPQSGTVTFVGTTTATINRGASAFNNLTFNGVGGSWSFSTTTLTLNGTLTIATGTVTLPTGTTSVGASFINSGGTFLHNNGEVRMTSTSGGRTITQSATAFLNHFYDLVFTGSGAWSYTEANATTSRNYTVTAGTVTFPSGQLTIGGDLTVSGTGAFTHNSGEVVFLVQDADTVRTNGSSFNNVRVIGGVSSSWYNDSWAYRVPIVIQESQIDADLTNFPVYVNLDDLDSTFFSNVRSDGGDIRVTESDGMTEVPREVVSISTGSTNGELHFRATSVSSSTNSTYYLYFGNPAATDHASTSTYGARNVWSNGYVVVDHMGDLTTSTILNSTSTINGSKTSANNPLEVTTGKAYDAQDLSADSIQHAGTLLNNQNQYNISMWFNADALTGGNTDEQNFGRSLYGISAAGSPYQWLRVGGTVNSTNYTLCAYDAGTVCNVSSGAGLTTGAWYHVSVDVVKSATTTLRSNGVERLSFTNTGSGVVSTNFTIGDLRPARGINFDGAVDEVRVSSVNRTNAWRDAEYRNFSTSTSFYSDSAVELAHSRTFSDTNVTILGNLNLDTGGDSTLPTGTLSIGGSFTNNAVFYHSSGTVRFNSTAGAETIDSGDSNFATLEFNSASGDFTISENATATVAINLTNAQQFTLSSGRILASLGTFTHAANGASTTWTGSTLSLQSGTTTNLNARTHGGDAYATLLATASTTVKMWNSSAGTYSTTGSNSAIYSQDHNSADGDLYVFGNYLRTSGTEYWSYATDFDGTALGTSSVRQVDVRVSTSSSIRFSGATLNIIGGATASTTIAAQSGAFALSATNTALSAQYFTVTDTDVNGFGLYASSTINTFSDGLFNVLPGRSGLSISGSTIDTNPAEQYFRIGFATSSPGAASNATLVDGASSFVWFRDGFGGLYGENFDNADANPGALRFDDSSNSIVVSGTVYADDGVTTLGGPTCDGSTLNVRIVVNGGTYASSTSCSGVNGSYSFPSVNYVGDPQIVVYLDTNGGVKGSVVTKTPTSNVTNMHIYANRVITRHEDTTPLAISDMVDYDNDNDSDISFLASTSSLQLLPNTELFVFASTTFSPAGNVTLLGNGNSNGYEGTLQIGNNAVFTATGTETHTLAGRLVLATTSVLTSASSTFVFNATTTGKSITSPSTVTLYDVDFIGVGGGWNITANLNVLGEMDIDAGTVSGTGNITMQNGAINGNGILSMGGGTVSIYRTNTLGGTNGWTFNNLTLGSGSVVGTTSLASNATTTILGLLTISNAHFLSAGGSVFDLAGSGTVFTETGTFLEATSTMRFSGSGSNIPSTSYYNLLADAAVSSPTYTAVGTGFIVYNDLTIGGTASSTLTFNTNDPAVEVRGDVIINNNGTLQASNSANLTVLGDWDNNGTFVGNSGTVLFTTTGTSNIAAGASSFGNVTINGTGNFVIIESATSTGSFLLTNHSNFTVNNGVVLAVGGQFTNTLAGGATTWASSTLSLYGSGTYEINASTTADVYGNLVVGAGTQIRMWNSSANSYSLSNTGSLYSQDHNGVDGNLYIYGQLIRSTGTDHWSYATDFDGTSLSSPRGVDVYLASGSSVLYNGATLNVLGSSTASTTIQNQGSGTYALTISTGATTNWNRAVVRDVSANGVVFAGTPTVTDFSYTDHLVEINSGSAITVGGTAIDANPAKNFTNNIFNDDVGVTGAINVTATGTSISSWRFTNHEGDIDGETFNNDPDGDPGYIVWDDSAALITVSGVVYSDEGSTLSTICDGVTNNIRLVVAGLTTYDATCSAASSTFSIPGVAFSPLDTLTLFINGETERAANVSVGPISSIGNMHLYHNRVIVRHENTNPMTIADMAVYDSSDDADIPFTAVNAGTDTLTLPSNYKLLVWTGKTFTPGGNVTLTGAGSNSSYDGTLEVQNNASFVAQGTESHSIWGSVIFGTGATLTSASSTLTLTSTSSGKTFDVNAGTVNNLTVNGASGGYTITDSTLTLTGSYTQSAATVTFPTGTTTIGAAFNATGGSFTNNGSHFVFTGAGAGNTVRFDDSNVASLTFTGSGSWTMSDTNATSTGSVNFNGGTVTLPSGSLAVGGNFIRNSGNFTHNTAELVMTAVANATITASSTDLHAINFVGPATYTITDTNITFLDSFTVSSGTVTMASGTTAVGGSLLATGGSFTQATGTVLLNSTSAGRTINPGSSNFYNLQISAPSGGYTMYTSTTTNNFTISSVNNLTLNSGARVYVGGVFSNSVGSTNTTWTNSTLVLNGGNNYSINGRTNAGDTYGTLEIGANSDIRMWYSSAATTTVATSSSLYSQDHANQNGDLYIYGDLVIATTTEYWSYATDFDGTNLTGSERQVEVFMASNATTTVTSGTLNIVGVSASTTEVQNQGSGTYSLVVNGGTLNANYYSFANLDISGLQLLSLSTITNLANGYYDIAVNTGSLISLSSTTLNANPSLTFDNVGFHATTGLSGFNVNLTGETSNAWRFTNNYGNIGTEGFDVDGIDACGSIRFDDSSCLLVEQTHYRWRNDDGGEGGLNSEWLNTSFTYRNRVRILNDDSLSYASTAIKVAVTYDSAMQSNFADLRFTSSDGVTEIPFWLERYTASTDATVWVRVPTVATSTYTTVFMYYGSSTATSTSSGGNTFTVFEDFEDNNITEYSGDTTLFKTDTSPVFGGSYALEANNTNGRTTNTLYRTDQTTAQGQIIRWRQYVSTDGDDACTLFAVGGAGANYSVCLIRFGTDRMSIVEDVNDSESSGTVHSSTTVTYSTGWYEVEVDWRSNNSITAYLYNSSGSLVSSTTATDATRTSGGLGFSFWIQNGSWDSYTARPLGPRTPTVYTGAKQTHGGATWDSSQDVAGNALPGDLLRLRTSVENSGLDITGQFFRLEYAALGASPTCESISGASFAVVPNQASCGTSPVCMATSTNLTDGDNTTDHLTGTAGTYTAGKVVASPSTQSASLDLDQDHYTELEYVLTPTVNASDSYCFRVTNAGTELDYYAKIAQLDLQFDPTFSIASLNAGLPITLTPGTTTIVIASSSVTDLNGYTDLAHATATIYRSGAGAACSADNNNCYIASTENGGCTFTGCSGSTCLLQCTADIQFFADPTDSGTYSGEEWLAYLEVEDSGEAYDFVSATGVELVTLRALAVDSLIDYGTLTSNSDTGSYNATTTISNLGNVAIDVDLEGTDLTDGGSSAIPNDNQKVATSTFTYSACVTCLLVPDVGLPVELGVDLTKPTTPTPPVEDDVFWGIAIPYAVSNAVHSGVNIFTAISP